MSDSDAAARIDRLMDAIDLIKADKREPARAILRELIRENGDFEDAWLWMSVAVDSLDQSAVCLDNVLRINPDNSSAAGALYRLRYSEMESERTRSRLRFYRDLAAGLFWFLVMTLLLTFVCNIYTAVLWLMSASSLTPPP